MFESQSDSETSIKDFDVCEDSIVTCDGRLLKLWKVVDNQVNKAILLYEISIPTF